MFVQRDAGERMCKLHKQLSHPFTRTAGVVTVVDHNVVYVCLFQRPREESAVALPSSAHSSRNSDVSKGSASATLASETSVASAVSQAAC